MRRVLLLAAMQVPVMATLQMAGGDTGHADGLAGRWQQQLQGVAHPVLGAPAVPRLQATAAAGVANGPSDGLTAEQAAPVALRHAHVMYHIAAHM